MTYKSIQQVDILAIGVHPDDVELGCSGSLLRQLSLGYTVGILDLSCGELGTRGNAALRLEESHAAAALMGASFRHNLGLADGFFEHNRASIEQIVAVVRAARPTIVLANALSDRHPDHGRAAKLVADACFFAGLLKLPTVDADGQPQERWRPRAVYHYIQDHNLAPDFCIDISDFIDRKVELVTTFGSQFYNPADARYRAEAESPISGKEFLDFVRAKAAAYGRSSGFAFAEGFNVARTPGVKDLFDLL